MSNKGYLSAPLAWVKKLTDRVAKNEELLTPVDVSSQFIVANDNMTLISAYKIGNKVEGVVAIVAGTPISNGFYNLFSTMPKIDNTKAYFLSYEGDNRNDIGKIGGRFSSDNIQLFSNSTSGLTGGMRVMFSFYLAE